MRKITMIIMMLLMAAMVQAVQIESGDRIYFDCHNNVSGAWEGSTATLTCYDRSGNTDVSGASATNIATGKYYYTFSETDDRYYCFIDCGTATSIDYAIPVAQGQHLQTSDNIGINLDDTSGTLSDAEIETITVSGDWATQANVDTECLDATELTSATVGTATTVGTVNALAASAIGVGDFASGAITADAIATDAIGAAEIADDAIGASELAEFAIQSSELGASAANEIAEDVYAYFISGANEDQFKATGFATQAQVDTECLDATELSSATVGTASTCTELTTNNDKTGYSLTTQDWTTDSDLTSLQSHGDSTWATATGFSTMAEINTSLQNGIVALTPATESQIDAIVADTSEIQGNQSNFLTADISSLATSAQATQILANQSVILVAINALTDLTAADVWTYATRVLTSFTPSWLFQNYTVDYNYDGDGFPYEDNYTYADGTVVTETWEVNATAITNKTVVVS